MSESLVFENGYCPSCGELPSQSGEIEWVYDGIDQKMECGVCGCKWVDHYELISSRKMHKGGFV